MWHLTESIVKYLKLKNTNEKYVLDFIVHMSQIIKSYALKTKTGHEVLICLKDFIYNIGKPKLILSNNGTEFRTNETVSFFPSLGIDAVFSILNHPQTNESSRSRLKKCKQKFISDNFTGNFNDFNITECLIETNYNHNNRIHSVTGYKPIDNKDCNDESIINEIKKILKNL